MSYGKGHEYLLQAINKMQVENDIRDIKVLIAGKVHEDEKKLSKKLGELLCESSY